METSYTSLAFKLLLGTEDYHVVNVEGKAFFHALRTLGREAELLAFEEEAHPLDGIEANRVSREVTVDCFGRKAQCKAMALAIRIGLSVCSV